MSSVSELVLPDGRRLGLDARGYLLDWEAWDAAVADQMASAEGLTLGPAHWQIIHLLREYYAAFEVAPPMRLLVKEVGQRLGPEAASSRYLYRLFPDGPAKQACRYAGLPKPVSCI
ncbi:sulfurtransferase TusE [Ahniella affigens]|uniref:Sulfurtransferase n=1 Tax=Ahniella affigens TaxID=2021234 RepID=A0A2P1PSI5_9GAMM|nr:TusE/DsrC/DsvC family sulfur relay protein [Ahniella affigens]AVP97784.1 sulfurtransferase TusE [Ahniella affigens]